jgi:hypothetical protein
MRTLLDLPGAMKRPSGMQYELPGWALGLLIVGLLLVVGYVEGHP